jgi:hypothetical protein
MGPLSGDLRKRVVFAVHEEDMSCRASARRFGVSFFSAIRWVPDYTCFFDRHDVTFKTYGPPRLQGVFEIAG